MLRSFSATNEKRSAAALLCVLLLFAAFVSFLYVVEEFHHDCSGEDCYVCASVAQCADVLRQIGCALALLSIVWLAVATAVRAQVLLRRSIFVIPSPVVRKIRLNN